MRINLIGGPGSGKSVLAARIFCELKIAGQEIELVQEYVKEMVYDGIVPQHFDQIDIFSNQLKREYRLVKKVKHIVTDSPLVQQLAYVKRDGLPFYDAIASACNEFERHYPSINFFLDRADIPYQQSGRYQNHEQAKEMDRLSLQVLDELKIPFTTVHARDFASILKAIAEQI